MDRKKIREKGIGNVYTWRKWTYLILALYLNPTFVDGSHCITEHCVTVSASIINSIDQSVNPCDDFYEYACGGWVKKNPIPDGKSMWGTFGKLEQDNQLVVKNVLGQSLFLLIMYIFTIISDSRCNSIQIKITFKVVESHDTDLVENNFYFTYIRSDHVRDYRC